MPKMGLISKNKNFYKRKRPKLLPRSIFDERNKQIKVEPLSVRLLTALAELAGFEPTG